MRPYFINYSDIYHMSFEYNKKQVHMHLNAHSKAVITHTLLPDQPIDIHIGDVSKAERVITVYENCIITRKKIRKGGSLFFITYEKSRGARLADQRPYLIDAILADLE